MSEMDEIYKEQAEEVYSIRAEQAEKIKEAAEKAAEETEEGLMAHAEKKLEVMGSLTDYYFIAWQYYEDGKLLKKLEKNYDEDTKLYHITYEENGIVTEKVMEEADYDNQYDSYSDLGEEYFPEFDFYWKG